MVLQESCCNSSVEVVEINATHSMTMNNTYTRIYSTQQVNVMVKEATRVKYIVNKVRVLSRRFVDSITVLDNDTNDVVFKAVRCDRQTWCVTLPSTYWQAPADVTGNCV